MLLHLHTQHRTPEWLAAQRGTGAALSHQTNHTLPGGGSGCMHAGANTAVLLSCRLVVEGTPAGESPIPLCALLPSSLQC